MIKIHRETTVHDIGSEANEKGSLESAEADDDGDGLGGAEQNGTAEGPRLEPTATLWSFFLGEEKIFTNFLKTKLK